MIHWHWTHATGAVTHARMKLKKTSIFSTGITAFLHLGSLQGTSALHLNAIATATLPTRSKTMRKTWHQVDGRKGTCLQYQSWNEKVESPCSSAVRTWTSGLHTSHWLLCTIWGWWRKHRVYWLRCCKYILARRHIGKYGIKCKEDYTMINHPMK